ncbi:Transglutaminase-like superfamily protein [Chitinophaga ginsengisegetis]|uniref:Transglutaminase-like superfamily protein n=1 Tax=Chitinophaga ginsengisegetis TaxID=393003 RepID=A0A1T5NIF0_9BACT|nr:transglutaminase-like domain-containing protein [Chitinophaga ginsengisegetis]MDR6569708.1 regulator of sirC expression with transglutaminase-like and TPR domain [Chitinophaga ginsengisegetis]MDR6649441.1 regulator of sirC expression with transglutaminase-like and TPR domain [Chitinophaga ginsengisegetis]MDR6655791.1 regulator of sirC expression with transglutaminase-like and TPR domain [Chitinophaga ginsengisegetis]SKD00205.1 Transglutaminase-like superfamily protein [Chitinophaga ginsengis
MNENREINALFHLLDDPDLEVFDTVASKILLYGKDIIPNLENLWENTIDEAIQERIELLIHRVHYQDLQAALRVWGLSETQDLMQGAILAARYQFPDLMDAQIIAEIDRIKRNIWLELNNYLTPLEQINVLNSMIYNYFGLKGEEVSYQRKNQFFINQVIESKKGNPVTNGIIYQSLCAMLDLPVYAVNIPRQFILAYFDSYIDFSTPVEPDDHRILFFIDPIQGQIYTQQDVDTYLKRVSVPPVPSYFKPQSNKRIVQFLLEELSKCFRDDKDAYKQDELINLASILED